MIPENPIETMDVYASQSQYLTGPDAAAQAAGTVPLDTLPADWWNWLWQQVTKRINETSQAFESIHNEILSVLQAASITPTNVSTSDLLNAIKAITRTVGSGDTAGAVKSSTKSGYVAIDSGGYMSPNGMGIPTSLNTTAKQIVEAINEVLASLNTYKTATNDSITGLTNSKAPNNHASTATTYGTGSSTNYGHVKLSNSTSSTSGEAAGIAATPAAIKAVNDSLASNVSSLQSSINGKAPTSHASSDTTYGTGSGTNYGHVKLSDSTSSTSGVSGGIAATPAAVKAVKDSLASNVSSLQTAIDGKAPTSHTSSATTYGIGSETVYGHVKLSDSTSSTSGVSGGIAATPAAVKAVKTAVDDLSTALMLPAGVTVPYAGATSPTGWLLCNGQAVSRTSYSRLFAVIGTTYGEGNGSTTFNVPDLRECNPVGIGKRASGVTNHNELTLGKFQDDQYQQHSHGVGGNTGSTQPTFTGTAHSHSFTPEGTVSSHSHSFTPEGTVSRHHHTFKWTGSHSHDFIIGSPSGGNSGKYPKGYYATNSTTELTTKSKSITVEGDTTSTLPSFTGTLGITKETQPTFTGTEGLTGNATAGGSVSSHSHSLPLTTSGAGKSAGGTHGKLLGMNYIIKT